MQRALVLVSLLAVARPAAPAAAQDCAEGRVRIEDVCCWPGQSLDEATLRCTGAPTCTSPLVRRGDGCTTPRALAAAGLPPPNLAALPHHPHDVGLLVAGAVTFVVGYTSAVVTSFLASSELASQGYAFVPVVHALALVPSAGEGGPPLVEPVVAGVIDVLGVALEVVGAVLIGLGRAAAHPLAADYTLRGGPSGLVLTF